MAFRALSTLSALALHALAQQQPSTPQQLHVTLHPDASALVVSFVTFDDASTSYVHYGPAATNMTQTATGRPKLWTNPCNITRTLHDVVIAGLPVGAPVFYTVSSDSVTWSAPAAVTPLNRDWRSVPAPTPALTLSLFGDMGVNCALSSVPQLTQASVAGAHQLVAHFGDLAYNLDDSCGANGDTFMSAVADFASITPVLFGVGNHETGPDYQYTDFLQRFAGQTALANASGSPSVAWFSVDVGPVHFALIHTDAWIYPLVYSLAEPQWRWLRADLAAVNRSATPWVVLLGHRAMYCEKDSDGECNSEAATLRDGFFFDPQLFGLEQLMLEFGVDMYFAGHTHHYQRSWVVANSTLVQANYIEPRAPVHVQSGIAGVDGYDAFSVPPAPYTAFRDEQYNPSFGRLTVHNATHATFQQLFASNGTVLDEFTIVQHSHGPFRT